MKRKQLRKKALLGLVLFAVLITVLTSVSLGYLYQKNTMANIRAEAAGYARMAASIIDGDRIEGYLATGEKDAYYESIQTFLRITQQNTGVKYYYVITLEDDGVKYVWDADAFEAGNGLGDMDEYVDDSREVAMAEMRADPPAAMTISHDPLYGYLATVYAPVFDSHKTPVALVGVDISMPNLQKTMMTFIYVIIIDVLLIVAAFAAMFFLYIRKNIVDPVGELNRSVRSVVSHLESEESFSLAIHTHDEIEELANSFETMYHEVHDYIGRLEKVTAEKERISAELDVAQKIQADMLPCIFPPFPNKPQLDIYAAMDPAKEVGGDFYDFFLIDENHLGIVMADVSGKGVPAALFMVIAKTLLNQRSRMGGSPAEVLALVNNMLCENNKADMFVTVWLGILDIATGSLTAANAGHEFPVLQRAGGAFELVKDRHGFVLAGMEDSRYRNYELTLGKGDRLFLYTDGVPEATNADSELFGTERMLAALNSGDVSNCRQVLYQVRQSVDAFVQDAPQFDDLTMLCLEYKGNA